jgi:hypothetical protein
MLVMPSALCLSTASKAALASASSLMAMASRAWGRGPW